MYEGTLIHLSAAYLNTNYINVEDICNCLWYGPSDTKHHAKIFKMIGEAIEPLRDERFDLIQSQDLNDWDLEIAAKIVAKKIKQIRSNIYRKRWI